MVMDSQHARGPNVVRQPCLCDETERNEREPGCTQEFLNESRKSKSDEYENSID